MIYDIVLYDWSMGETFHILVMLNMQMRPYFRQIVSGISEYAHQHQHPSWNLSLPNYFSFTHSFPTYAAAQYDGVITGVATEQFLNTWGDAGKAVSLIGFPHPCEADLTYSDLSRVIQAGTRLFVEGGAEHIAYSGLDDDGDTWSQEMISAFLTEHPDAALFRHQPDRLYQYEAEREQIVAWLRSLPAQTGILTGNDEYAGRIYEAAGYAGLRPGLDFTVLGLGNDLIYCESLHPALSSIQLPLRRMGYLAAKRLAERLDTPSLPIRHLESGSPLLVKRSSHYFHEVEDSLSDIALATLRAKLSTIRSVSDLAQELGTSRHTLQRRLKAVFGKTPAELIRDLRIQETRRLLSTTDMPLAQVAAYAGFTDQAHMTRILKSELGMTPGQLSRILASPDGN